MQEHMHQRDGGGVCCKRSQESLRRWSLTESDHWVHIHSMAHIGKRLDSDRRSEKATLGGEENEKPRIC